MTRRPRMPGWRREALRTTLWLVPSLMVAAVVALFVAADAVDRAASAGRLTLPGWVTTDGPDAARQVLIAIAAAMITVAGVVFSITILALTLASQQFGPRMLRNFIRDRGTQITLGSFVATFVFSVLALGAVTSAPAPEFVPNLCVTLALGLTIGSLGVLIYFIHHVATSIQLTSVVAGIAADLHVVLDEVLTEAAALGPAVPSGAPEAELQRLLDTEGAVVPVPTSGFLQAVGHERLIRIAMTTDAVIRLEYRPGHFLVEGRPLASVWPPSSGDAVAKALRRAHVVGPHRTLSQDLGFAIDQLVEISLRALSPAVNDTFTALNCIDWLGAGLSHMAATTLPDGVWRDAGGTIRLFEPVMSIDRAMKGAFDKIRQAGRGMPAVLIRQLENLDTIWRSTAEAPVHDLVRHHAALILRTSEESVAEPADRADVRRAHDAIGSSGRAATAASGHGT